MKRPSGDHAISPKCRPAGNVTMSLFARVSSERRLSVRSPDNTATRLPSGDKTPTVARFISNCIPPAGLTSQSLPYVSTSKFPEPGRDVPLACASSAEENPSTSARLQLTNAALVITPVSRATSSQFPPVHELDCVIHRSRCQRHVGDARILIRGRRHACAVGHEHVGHIPHLIV